MYPNRFLLIGLLIGTLIFKPAPSGAVSTILWEARTQTQFRAGEAQGVSLTPDGKVILAPPLRLLFSAEEFYVWSLAKDRKGNIYAGTGNGGKVFKIEGGKASLHFDPPGAQIYSLSLDKKGDLYVGSSPEGVVYRVTPDGRSSQFFKTDEKYIWAMVFDDKGNLWVGCGETGKIYSINRKGEGTLACDLEERHVLSLLWHGGRLYAGTEGKGLVYEITPQVETRGIFDPPEEEVRSLVLDESGGLYLAAVKGEGPAKEESADNAATNTPSSLRGEGKRSAIYRVSPEGAFTKVWSSETSLALSLCLGRDNLLLAGTGDEGRLHLIDPVEGGTDLFQCEEAQILSLLAEDEEIYLGTGNMGRVYHLRKGYREQGELTSKSYDTGTISRWGRISWAAETPSGTRISLSTRTGNTEEVNKTWSNWSGKCSNGGHIKSPPARFIQWRATLSTSDAKITPALNSVQVAYLPQNLPPTITSLSVLPSGVGASAEDMLKTEFLPHESKSALQRRGIALPDPVYQLPRGLRSAWWKAEDPNGDRLLYTLYFRGRDEREWKILEDDLLATDYTFDSFSLPDGYYRVKLKASDVPGNTKETALSTEKVSEGFVVDNSPPRVRDLKVDPGSRKVSLKAKDELSLLATCQYSVDGGDWRSLSPADGMFDSRAEEFRFKLEELPGGEHTIGVKVKDQSLNVGSSRRVFYIR